MATYKDIVGTAIRNNAGNLPSAQQDQIFFDSTNIDFKYQFPNTLTSWRTGNNLNSARGYLMGSGTQTAGLAFGGFLSTNADTGATESYDGTNWTELNDMNTTRRDGAGNGTQTSSLVYGGAPKGYDVTKVKTESWNGSSWTEVAYLNTGRRAL